MKNKKNYNFFNPNKLILGVLIVSVVMLSSLSYAWYKLSITGTKEITLSSGALELSFNDTDSGIISIENGEPLTDEDGLATRSYNFTLKNTGSIDSNFTIYLDDEALSNSEIRMSDSNIKYSLVKTGESPSVSLLNKNKSFTNDKGVTTRSILTDKISAGSTTTYTLKVWIADNADNAVMNTSFKAKLRVEATQYIEPKLCKRATILHTTECNQTDNSLYCSGAGYTLNGSKKTSTITYGFLGDGLNLTSGDAFDCDVNGDGKYDSEKERFYYVADSGDSQATAVMIYYNNVSEGIPNNAATPSYDTGGNGYTNGPTTVILRLPTTSQWTNVSLQNITRDLTDELGTVRKKGFSYQGYAARFLTIQEVEKACGVKNANIQGELDNCDYLMENTKYSSNNINNYGYWLESLVSTSSNNAWNIFVNVRSLSYSGVNRGDHMSGARPVIEVPKSRIEY